MIYWRNPDTGLIESIDESGRTVAVQRSLDSPFDSATKAGFKEVVRPDGTSFWVQEGVDVKEVKSWFYNPMLGAVIAGEVASGARLSKLREKSADYPPYAILARWMSTFPDFKSMVDQALKDRALLHFEEVIDTADENYKRMAGSEDEHQAAKLKIDARKFLAEKGDRDKFGTKPSTGGEGSVTILIQTGIDREPRDVTHAPKIGLNEPESGAK